MIVKAIKTERIFPGKKTIFEVLDSYLKDLPDKSVIAITSKIVSLCENRVVPTAQASKDDLLKKESQYYLPPDISDYGYNFTITDKTLIPSAGIDESNVGGDYYLLWPQNSQATANEIRSYLKSRFKLKHIGVIITDSTMIPLRWGTMGIALAYSGFNPLKNYVGQEDLFGRPFKVSVAGIATSLAAAVVVVMGEGTEQTPIALVSDIPFVEFQDRDPTKEELAHFKLNAKEDDIFGPFLTSVPWQKGAKAPE